MLIIGAFASHFCGSYDCISSSHFLFQLTLTVLCVSELNGHAPPQLPHMWYIGCNHNSLWRGVLFREGKKAVFSQGEYFSTLRIVIFDGLRSIFIPDISLLSSLW